MDEQAYRDRLRDHLVTSAVPEHIHNGLIEYIVARRPVGHFLTAVLSNDLAEACARSDDVNRFHLYHIVFFLYNYAPAVAWGSPERVTAWLTSKDGPPLYMET